MKRNVLIAIPAILVVLIAILLIAPGFIDWNRYKGQVQDQVKTATGFTAELRGPISLSLLPTPHVSIADVQIAAPSGSASDTLARLGRADVHLAFIPLLSGKIAFDSITLVEPSVALEVFADGRQNWMTPELDAMMKGGTSGGAGPQVSVKNISIEKGAFSYTDRSKKDAAPLAVNDVNIDASADTLQGPFKGSGSFALSGHTIDFEGTTGAIDETGAVTVKGEGSEKPAGISFKYAGVVTTKGPFQMQGETSLDIASLEDMTGSKAIGGGLKISGLLTASQQKIMLKNATIGVAGSDFTGDVGADLNPLKIAGDLKTSDTVSLDKFIKGGKTGKSGPLLPQTITLPMPFDAGLKLSAPGLIWQNQVYSNVELLFSKQDKMFAVNVTSGSIPGKGKIDLKAALSFAAKSASKKDGSEVYSEPSLLVTVKGDSQNVTTTAEALSGMDNLSALSAWKSGAVDATIAVAPDSLAFRDTAITLGDSKFNVTGSYGMTGGIDMTISGQASDARALMKAAGMDVSALPSSLEGAAISVAAKGTREKLAVDANIKALNGDLSVKADVDKPFEKAAFSNMVVEAKHPNLAEALQKLSPGSARYVSLEKPLTFYAEIEPKGRVYSLKNMKASFAGTPVTGTVSLDTGAAKPAITGDLAFDNLSIQSQRDAGGSNGGSHWSSEPMDTTWINSYDADLDVKAESIVYQNWDLAKPVLKIALHGGKLDIRQFDSGLFGGQMKMTAMLQGGSGNKGFSDAKVNATFRSVSMEQLVKALVGTQIIKASGDVDFDTDMSTSGTSQAALVSGLKGSGTTAGRKLVMQGFDLNRFAQTLAASAKPGERLAGIWQSTASGGSTAFETMDGAYTVTGGIVNLTKLNMDSTTTSLATTGNINLPQWTLATAHTITFKDKPEIQPYTIKMSGSLSNPAQSLGQGLISGVINQQIENKLQDLLANKLGVPKAQPAAPVAGVPAQAAPAAGDAAVAPEAQQPVAEQPAQPSQPLTKAEKKAAQKAEQKQQQQQAIQGLLQGVLGGH